MEAAKEVACLEKNGTWKEVSVLESKTKILPGTWVFWRKQSPDGEINKNKARYCVQGNLKPILSLFPGVQSNCFLSCP
jgi:hypothetical protein